MDYVPPKKVSQAPIVALVVSPRVVLDDSIRLFEEPCKPVAMLKRPTDTDTSSYSAGSNYYVAASQIVIHHHAPSGTLGYQSRIPSDGRGVARAHLNR